MMANDNDVLAESTRLINEIGTGMVHDPAYLALPWDAIALVVEVADGGATVSQHGYAYLDDGTIAAEVPEGETLTDLFRDLNREMVAASGKRPWKAALVQIVRATGKMGVEYEYDDASRWQVTPSNWETMREQLRPADG